MAEMTALKYFEEKARMTKNCEIRCMDCSLHGSRVGTDYSCTNLEYKHPEQAIAIVQKWAQERPRKTFLQDFLEKHPNAPLWENGMPMACPRSLGYPVPESFCEFCEDEDDCIACWDQPLEG